MSMCSLILSYLSYACEIWGNTYKTKLNCLYLLQKRTMRIIDGVHFRDHTNDIFAKYSCLKLFDIIDLKTLMIVYKAKHRLLPENLQCLLIEFCETHNYNTRSSSKGNFTLRCINTRAKSMCISVRGIKLWNQFNLDVASVHTIHSFKNITKKYMISQYT